MKGEEERPMAEATAWAKARCQERVWPEAGHVARTGGWQGERGQIKPIRSAGARPGTSLWGTAGSGFILRA